MRFHRYAESTARGQLMLCYIYTLGCRDWDTCCFFSSGVTHTRLIEITFIIGTQHAIVSTNRAKNNGQDDRRVESVLIMQGMQTNQTCVRLHSFVTREADWMDRGREGGRGERERERGGGCGQTHRHGRQRRCTVRPRVTWIHRPSSTPSLYKCATCVWKVKIQSAVMIKPTPFTITTPAQPRQICPSLTICYTWPGDKLTLLPHEKPWIREKMKRKHV